MSPNLEKDLFKAFPHLFQDDEGNASCTVISVGDGWYSILSDFLKSAERHLKDLQDEDDGMCDFRITEIKEKFGSLRIYSNFVDEHIFDLIEQASDASTETCELSGQTGSLHGKMGVLKTLAPDVASQYGYEPVDTN